MTSRQRAVLEHMIKSGKPLSYGGEGHWFFSGENLKIHATTGFSILSNRWIKSLAREEDDPFWLSKFKLTPEGRAALRARRRARKERAR